MLLDLSRPVAFIDLETTGVNVASDRIIEIAILKVSPDGNQSMRTHRVNPQMPIHPSSTQIHGITDADVASEPTFNELAPGIFKFIFDCDLAGYNSNRFDIPMLVEEFLRAGIDFDIRDRKFIDVQNIFHKMEQRTLKAAYQFYCEKELHNAHCAEDDIRATYEILEAQLSRYPNLEKNVGFLESFSQYHRNVDCMGRVVWNDDDQEIFNFGKFKGQIVEQVFEQEPGYYGWLMNGDFPLYTKKILKEIMDRVKEKRKAERA